MIDVTKPCSIAIIFKNVFQVEPSTRAVRRVTFTKFTAKEVAFAIKYMNSRKGPKGGYDGLSVVHLPRVLQCSLRFLFVTCTYR